MNRWWRLAVAGIVSIATPSATRADIVDLAPVADNTLYEDAAGGRSNGAGQYLFAGLTNDPLKRRAVLRFDVAAAIPAGSTITSAQLHLNMSRTQAGSTDVRLHRLLADWGEGTSDANSEEGGGAPSTTGDATWIHRAFSTTRWATPGGDFAATASATTAVAGNGSYAWGSSAALVADVQDWLNGTAPNHGWIVIGVESGSQTAKRFDSRENPTAANRPRLNLVYTPPARGACCDASGGCALTDAAACAGGFQGVGTVCGAGGTCGACCDGGTCAIKIAATCTSYRGDGSACTPDPCAVPPTGACCASDGTCTVGEAAVCTGSYQGNGTTCGAGGTCGACCDGGTCAIKIAATCTSYRGDGSACTPDPCAVPLLGACCAAGGSCTLTDAASCPAGFQGVGSSCGAGGTCGACCDGGTCALRVAATCTSYRGDGSACTPDLCAPPALGACCQDTTCTDGTTAAGCVALGGVFQGIGQMCSQSPCADESRACCFSDGTCQVINRDVCDALGGDRQGGDSTCAPSPCGPRGACCLAGTCTDDLGGSQCGQLGGTYHGDGSDCSEIPCGPAPTCNQALIGRIRLLKAVKVNAGRDVQMTWSPDANANGYNAWYVGDKAAIPTATSAGPATGVPGCLNRPTTDCLHPGAVAPAAGTRLFYNVLGACDGLEAAN